MTAFPESHADLLETQFATLGSIDEDGRPQLTEVWFLHEDGELKVSLNDDRAKARYLRERPACSLLILDLANPFRYLEVRGHAHMEADAERAFARRVGTTYGADLAQYDAPGSNRIVVTIVPEAVYPVDMSG
jgi:PPOX class probable F420-dependent enzyme